ncbi:unknown [Bacteroides sp. CAG:598]|nr:unknown [Bacteroides sp. CAG:598]
MFTLYHYKQEICLKTGFYLLKISRHTIKYGSKQVPHFSFNHLQIPV